MNTTTRTTTTRSTHRGTGCPTAWIGSGIYSTTTTTYVICELPLTDDDGNEIPNTACGYADDTDVTYDDLGLTATWTCPTCQRTNEHTPGDGDDSEPDDYNDWD
ncbi:hypothetical protein [Kineococcus rhizosphaerae]|uniref:Uncharacterized protein n=1 Tax=Kineococcus rhizosphaerae TaxID=559628 RepID=A0A2T0QPZ8_9ACTN|nr:hypothetical protein [Kineococcus rhizosphaerae]PRY06851.1 hypothetical protein CLV37_1311 [Kineococcus rhizosphaerae]